MKNTNSNIDKVTQAELLSDAIGGIDDSFIESEYAVRESKTMESGSIRRIGFLSKQFMGIAAAALILVAGTALMFSVFGRGTDDTSNNPDESDIVTTAATAANAPKSIGDVYVVSGGKEYGLFVHATGTVSAPTYESDGAMIDLSYYAEQLPVIPYHDDFEIKFNKTPNAWRCYSLYDSDFEEIYLWNNSFAPPTEDGVYYFVFSCSFTDKERDGYYTRYYDFAAKLTVGDVPTAPEYAWIVEPQYEYDRFFYCYYDNRFIAVGIGDYEYLPVVDEKNGELITDYGCTHGFDSGRMWVYDPNHDLFGYYLKDDCGGYYIEREIMPYFKETFPDETDKIKVVGRVNFAMCDAAPGGFKPNPEAFSGYAVYFGNEPVTDYIFKGGKESMKSGRRLAEITSVIDQSDKQGVVDKNGKVILPFDFDEVMLISETTAFVCVDGKWGIVGFNGHTPKSLNEYDLAPLELLGYKVGDNGKMSGWIYDNFDFKFAPDDFRKYFFGVWEADQKLMSDAIGWDGYKEITFDDTDKSYYRNRENLGTLGYNKANKNVLVYEAPGPVSSIWWIDINNPDTMYYADFGVYLADTVKKEVYYEIAAKTNKPVNQPKDGYMSMLKLREIERDYGIYLKSLINITYDIKSDSFTESEDPVYTLQRVEHDNPVYLVSKSPNKLVFKTNLTAYEGGYSDLLNVDVTCTFERYNGDVGGDWGVSYKLDEKQLQKAKEIISSESTTTPNDTFTLPPSKMLPEPNPSQSQNLEYNDYPLNSMFDVQNLALTSKSVEDFIQEVKNYPLVEEVLVVGNNANPVNEVD
ncbi:MAG: WG repeat-containing protein, partial [Oscillospiraceae bacterium]|nr:WG repeat-containing protein [Oscillospiraceae bacterium]